MTTATVGPSAERLPLSSFSLTATYRAYVSSVSSLGMHEDLWRPPDLTGRVAIVTGASRGVGAGICEVLAECGATVVAVSRSAPDSDVRQEAGVFPVRCDLASDASIDQLGAICARLSRVDLLVNNAVGWASGADADNPFVAEPPWRAPTRWWDDNFVVGVRSHYRVTMTLLPLLIESMKLGLVVFTTDRAGAEPGAQELIIDLRSTVIERMSAVLAAHLAPHAITSIVLYAGFTRTESIARSFRERRGPLADWTEEEFLTRTASPSYAGRAIASLAADPELMTLTGSRLTSYESATRYGFTDIAGNRPDPD